MLSERVLERVAPINGHSGGDAIVGETSAPCYARQGVLQRLKPRQEPVLFDCDAWANGRGPRLLQIGDDTLELDDTALMAAANFDVGIDDHDGLNACRQRREQVTECAWLVTVHILLEAPPTSLAQAFRSVIRRTVADEPDVIEIRLQPLHELIELIFEIEYRRNDRVGKNGSRADAAASSGREIDRQLTHFGAAELGSGRGMAPMHIEPQPKIQRIGEHDHIRQSIDQEREVLGLNIRG